MMFAARVLGALLLVAAAEARLLMFLPLNDTSGTRATDYSGNNRHGTYVNGPRLEGVNGVRLDGNNDHITLPNNLLRNLQQLTVSIDVRIRPEQTGYYFIFGLGNTDSRTGNGNGYVFATGDPLRAAISPGSWEQEAEVRTRSPIPRDTWRTLTFVVNAPANRIELYADGAFLGTKTNNGSIISPASLGGGNTNNNYIGRSLFTRDNYLAGSVRNFRLWDNALSAQQIASPGFVEPAGGQQAPPPVGPPPLPPNPTPADRVGQAIMSIDLGPTVSDLRHDIVLPQEVNGIPIVWTSSHPNIIDSIGRVTRPPNGDVLVTLTATVTLDGVRGERTFQVLVRRAGT